MFSLNKLEICSQRTKVFEVHGLIKFIHVYVSKNLDRHEREGGHFPVTI